MARDIEGRSHKSVANYSRRRTIAAVLGDVWIELDQRLANANMFADDGLGRVAQFMTVLAVARLAGELASRRGNGRQSQPARRADDILRQPRRLVPFFLGTGLR